MTPFLYTESSCGTVRVYMVWSDRNQEYRKVYVRTLNFEV